MEVFERKRPSSYPADNFCVDFKTKKMRDQSSVTKVAELHPAIRDGVVKAIEAFEAKDPYRAIRIAQGLRTIEFQNSLFAQGRTKPGKIVTKARGGQSWHNYGLAVDCAILYDKDRNGAFEKLSWDLLADDNRDGDADWKEMVDSFKSEGFEWGGDWLHLKDNDHFEMRFGMPEDCSTAFQKYRNKDFLPGTQYIVII